MHVRPESSIDFSARAAKDKTREETPSETQTALGANDDCI